MRPALAILGVAVALAGAIYVDEHRVPVYARNQARCMGSDNLPILTPESDCANLGGTWLRGTRYVARHAEPSWVDPVAVLVAVGGVALAAGLLATGRHNGRPPRIRTA
jgi:hypothetical protein